MQTNSIRERFDLYTEEELAGVLNVTVDTLAKWRSNGLGPAFTKPTKEVFYRGTDVLVWLAGCVQFPKPRNTDQPPQESSK